ncbi:hypothetical protein LOC72_22075 [Roseiconus lacunae]|nr:hypothetical protein [Roseiconus lacunae]
MCRFFVEQFCPGGKDGFFSASLWYSDPPFEKLYVHSTYGYDYCFQKKALPIASSCIGKQLTAGDGKVARYTPDDDDYREKDKAEMAGVQSLHVVEVGMEAPEKMAFVCHCFDANWRNYSPELSAFRHFGNLVEKFASSAERWKIRHALMDLNWRFAYAARMNNEVLPIEYLSRILRDRLAAFFESRGCTIFLAEGDGTELYPIATFGLREDRLRSHEGRLVPEREIVAYDLTQRGLLKLLVECPRLAVSVNDLEDYKNIVKSYPFLVHRKPRRELQESSLSSMDDSRFLGVGLQFPKLKFVIRLSRRLSDPPFRNADKQLLLAISQFLEANSLWNSAVDSLATTFSASAYRAWPSSCDPGCTDDQEIDLDILRENCNGECG